MAAHLWLLPSTDVGVECIPQGSATICKGVLPYTNSTGNLQLWLAQGYKDSAHCAWHEGGSQLSCFTCKLHNGSYPAKGICAVHCCYQISVSLLAPATLHQQKSMECQQAECSARLSSLINLSARHYGVACTASSCRLSHRWKHVAECK